MWSSLPILLYLVAEIWTQDFEPRIVISPSSNPVQKPAGQQVSLLCTVERLNASSRPGILWTKHGGIDRTGNIEVKKLDAFTMSLVISNTSSEDSGVYTCQVQYGEHLLQKNVDVIIFENFNFIEKTTAIGHVMATATVNLSCEVKPFSDKVQTAWSRHGVSVDVGEKYKLYKNHAILEISNYNPLKDAGEYVCKVWNALSGSALYRRITLGTERENKQLLCTNMCNNLCSNLFTSSFNP